MKFTIAKKYSSKLTVLVSLLGVGLFWLIVSLIPGEIESEAILVLLEYLGLPIIFIVMSFLRANSDKQWIKTKDTSGTLIIDTEQILIKNQQYLLDEIKELKLVLQGRVHAYINLSFVFNGKVFKYNLDFPSDKNDKFKELLQKWYEKRINFKEYYEDDRSFLFEGKLPYERVQEIKNKYNIKGLWV